MEALSGNTGGKRRSWAAAFAAMAGRAERGLVARAGRYESS